MQRIRASQPSPAIIVAVLALVVALAGTAIAGPDAITSALTKSKVKRIAQKQANKQITKRAPGLSVARAQTANTADSATQAQNAVTANGLRPVKVNFTAPSDTPATPLLDQGGVRLTGTCNPGGTTDVRATSTANNGLVKFAVVDADGTSDSREDLDFDVAEVIAFNTSDSLALETRTVTITYRGANGTEVSGDVVIAQGAAAAQCVIAGTLFVG